jgi:hypothetical protein
MVGLLVTAGEPVDLDAVNKIRTEAFKRSQVMDTAWYLCERIGPRVTGSPQHRQATEWTRDKLAEWGLKAWLEGHEFDHGWSLERCQVHMVAPLKRPLLALPRAWTPATNGAVRAPMVRARLASAADLEAQRGKLAGAIVLLDQSVEPGFGNEMFSRMSDDDLAEEQEVSIPSGKPPAFIEYRRRQFLFCLELADFLVEEGVVATIEASAWDNGLVNVDNGGSRGSAGVPAGVPALVMAAEHYNHLVRLLDDGAEVELELEVAATFHHDEDRQAYTTLGELPGSDLAEQVVMAGAHLDSWHAGTGATDNGGSCAVVMEALRLLKAAGLEPRRTIRIALWHGEEQGFQGSRAYVARHLATRPQSTDEQELVLPSILRPFGWPITPLPDHAGFSAYFNLDYGAGRIRGIYTMDNVAVKPIFSAWLEPLHDLGATTVTTRWAGGTDHMPFDWVGLPGFVFIQDELEYNTRTHHTNIDTYDHLIRDDLVQASIVVATFLWHAANRDELLPRKPMPQE